MKKRNTRDPYVPTRRQLQIENCLYEMLLSESYSSITISDICRRVGLSRRTFYSYFADKEACLRACIDHFIRTLLMSTSQTAASGSSILQVCITLMTRCKEQRALLDILSRNGLSYLLLEQSIRFTLSEDRTYLSAVYPNEDTLDEDIIACHVACQVMLVQRWHKRGFDTSVEEMGQKYLEISRLTLSHLTSPGMIDAQK